MTLRARDWSSGSGPSCRRRSGAGPAFIGAIGDPHLDDPPWFVAQLVQRDRLYPGHRILLWPPRRMGRHRPFRTYKAGDCRVHGAFIGAAHRPGGGCDRRRSGDRPGDRPRSRRLRCLGGHLGARCGDCGGGGERSRWARSDHRRARLRTGRCRPCPHDGGAGTGADSGQQCRGVFLSPILETSENGLGRALPGPNLKHVMLCTQRVARTMVESGTGGSIISVTSIEGVRAAPGSRPMPRPKPGSSTSRKPPPWKLAPYGIRVNTLAPDITMTEGMASQWRHRERRRDLD